MTLTVEDGSQVSGANSYGTVADMQTYATARGETAVAALSEAAAEILMIKAMDYLEGLRDRYKGDKVARTQALEWPRVNAYDIDYPGAMFPSNDIPTELINAQYQLAIEAYTNDLQPNRLPSTTGPIVSEKVGPLEVAYSSEKTTGFTPAFAKVEALLAPLLKHNGMMLVRS